MNSRERRKIMEEKFIPTHRMQIGTGKRRTYWLVQINKPTRRGKKDGLLYYAAYFHPPNRSGVHILPKVPETRLKTIKQTGKEHTINKQKLINMPQQIMQ